MTLWRRRDRSSTILASRPPAPLPTCITRMPPTPLRHRTGGWASAPPPERRASRSRRLATRIARRCDSHALAGHTSAEVDRDGRYRQIDPAGGDRNCSVAAASHRSYSRLVLLLGSFEQVAMGAIWVRRRLGSQSRMPGFRRPRQQKRTAINADEPLALAA